MKVMIAFSNQEMRLHPHDWWSLAQAKFHQAFISAQEEHFHALRWYPYGPRYYWGQATDHSDTLAQASKKIAKAAELRDWMKRAEKELKGLPPRHVNRTTYNNIKAAVERLEQEIETEQTELEQSLTENLEGRTPIALTLEGGEHRTVTYDGRGGSLLPKDLLAVWKVVQVFGGELQLGLDLDGFAVAPTLTKKGKR